jgi:DEAD/DEAH box helicase domain-containing protein
VVFYIGGSSALDQFLMQHPDYFFGRSPEAAMINPENLAILSSHLRCAAFELPFDDGESFGPVDPAPVLQFLEDEKVVRHSGGRWHYSSDVYPAQDVSLRSGSGENFIVLDTGNANAVIAEVDYDSAPFLLHDDAVYIHNGRTYLVEKLDWDRRTAFVRHRVVDYYTDAEASSNVQVLQVDEEEADARLGSVSVATEIARFKKVKFESQESIGYGPVTLPQLEIQTEAAWLLVPEEATAQLKAKGLLPGPALAGLAQLLRGVVPLFVLCDPADFSTMAMVRSTFDRVPAVYLWDRHPGGIGIARRFFQMRRAALAAARQRARECTCQHGCPACVGAQLDAKSRAREGALALLDYMAGERSASN